MKSDDNAGQASGTEDAGKKKKGMLTKLGLRRKSGMWLPDGAEKEEKKGVLTKLGLRRKSGIKLDSLPIEIVET